MRKIYVYVFGLLFAAFLLVSTSFGSITASLNIASAGVIQSADDPTFQIRGADVPLDAFFPGNINYQPNAWTQLQDLHINLIRCFPGNEGDVAHFSISDDANWATNLNNFLTTANSYGIKVCWEQLGSSYSSSLFFGIIPETTPIATAKSMIDKLEGSNSLGHDFITDPRVWVWDVSNEQDLSVRANLNWNLNLTDYIRSKGGRAEISFARWGNWEIDPTTTGNILYGHVDQIQYHMYGEYEYVNYFHYGTTSYGQWNNLTAYLTYEYQQMLSTPHFSADQIFLGEFGCWRGLGSNEGLSNVNFTDQDRINIYSAAFNAAKAAGVQNLCFHFMFSETDETPDYGIVKDPASGTGYWDNNLAGIIRTSFAGTS